MKLAIVCGGPSSEMLAPFDDPEYEIWVLGNRCDRYPRFDRIFEIHDDNSHIGEGYEEWLASKNVPLVVGEKFPFAGEHIECFPYADTEDLFGSLYLTSSSAMMLAYAMLKGYQHIEIYGVDMATDDFEYFWQRPCMEAWVGFARGRGHTVTLHSSSPVCRSGYVEGRGSGGLTKLEPFTEDAFSRMATRHLSVVEEINGQIAVLQAKLQGHDGAAQAYKQMAKVARAVEAGNEIESLESQLDLR